MQAALVPVVHIGLHDRRCVRTVRIGAMDSHHQRRHSGTMGAQIAAHLANAKVPVVLFELPSKEGDPNGNVLKAIDNLRRLEPSPLALMTPPTPFSAAFPEPSAMKMP